MAEFGGTTAISGAFTAVAMTMTLMTVPAARPGGLAAGRHQERLLAYYRQLSPAIDCYRVVRDLTRSARSWPTRWAPSLDPTPSAQPRASWRYAQIIGSEGSSAALRRRNNICSGKNA